MAWGGGGTGFDRIALRNMMRIHPKIHYSSDHTLSRWAGKANVTFYQATWSNMQSKWCPLKIFSINSTTWKCHSNSKQTHRFQRVWGGDLELV